LQVAQTIHAAGESSPGRLPDGTYAIALAVADEPALIREVGRLQGRGFACVEPGQTPPDGQLAFVPIYEPDPPYHGALMAIGIVPARREVLRRHLSSLATVK
jgi:hypothetical protein